MRGALLFAVLLLLPVALADHVYSHRVYVVGRLLDVEGEPAAGVAIDLTFDGITPTGLCLERAPEVTGPRGDYEICRHTHGLPSRANVTVRAGNVSRTVGIDQNLRLAVASFRLNGTSLHDVSGQRQFSRQFDVVGRAFSLNAKPQNEEGVEVNATPIFDNVTIQLLHEGATLAQTEASPDLYGIYRAQLAIEELPEGTIVRATVGRESVETLADATFRRADVSIIRDLRLAGGFGEDAPGSSATPVPWWSLLVAFSVALAVRRRRSLP